MAWVARLSTLSASSSVLRSPLTSVSHVSPSLFNLGSNLLLRRNTLPPRKLFIIRAARTESRGVSLGFRPPSLELPEPLTGRVWKLEGFESHRALLVMFVCNHCPFVIHLKKAIVKLSNFYMKKGLAVVAISSNSVITHQQDGPEFMSEDAKLFKLVINSSFTSSQIGSPRFPATLSSSIPRRSQVSGKRKVERFNLVHQSASEYMYSEDHVLVWLDDIFFGHSLNMIYMSAQLASE